MNVNHVSTRLPVNPVFERRKCEADPDDVELPKPRFKNRTLLQDYERILFDPKKLFDDEYCYDAYYSETQYETAYDVGSPSYKLQLMNNGKCDFFNIFNSSKWNEVYNRVSNYDVMIFLEYGLFLNNCSRLKVMNDKTRKDTSVNHGMHSYSCEIYCYDVGFRFNYPETGSDVNSSFQWTQFTDNVLSSKNDYGIRDMICHALYVFGSREVTRFPLTNMVSVKREGFGFFLNFLESNTFLCCTVVCGRFPYVIPSTIRLKDRDYEDFAPEQGLLVMRRTGSRLSCSEGEYEFLYETVPALDYKAEVGNGNSVKRVTSTLHTVFVPEGEMIFDCPLNFAPVMDTRRNGVSIMLPAYGGFSVLYALYFHYFYSLYNSSFDRRVSLDTFFVSPTSLFNFMCGTSFPYVASHAMYSVYRAEGETAFAANSRMEEGVNPRTDDFVRVLDCFSVRSRDLSKKTEDGFPPAFVIVLELEEGPLKYYINDSGYTLRNLLQTAFPYLDDYPVRENVAATHFYVLNPGGKPVYMDKPFSFVVRSRRQVVPNVITLRFSHVDRRGRFKPFRPDPNDAVVIKGSFMRL